MYECEGKRYELIKADSTNSCKDCVFLAGPSIYDCTRPRQAPACIDETGIWVFKEIGKIEEIGREGK